MELKRISDLETNMSEVNKKIDYAAGLMEKRIKFALQKIELCEAEAESSKAKVAEFDKRLEKIEKLVLDNRSCQDDSNACLMEEFVRLKLSLGNLENKVEQNIEKITDINRKTDDNLRQMLDNENEHHFSLKMNLDVIENKVETELKKMNQKHQDNFDKLQQNGNELQCSLTTLTNKLCNIDAKFENSSGDANDLDPGNTSEKLTASVQSSVISKDNQHTVMSRISHNEVATLVSGYGFKCSVCHKILRTQMGIFRHCLQSHKIHVTF